MTKEQTSKDEDHDLFTEEFNKCVLHPHSQRRIVWDFCSLFLVVYDMIMIPMSMFDMPENLFLSFMEWTTRLFWSLDMGLSTRTAVIMKDGSVNFEFWFILKKYFKTWFALDVLIVSTDWFEVVLQNADGAGALGRLSRIFRVARIVRLLRLMRLQQVMRTISERIQSDKLSFGMSIIRLTLAVMGFTHLSACVWWRIGARWIPETVDRTWASKGGYRDMPFEDQYLASLLWAFGNFSGIIDLEVWPTDKLERIYAAFIGLVAFMSTAILLAILTSNLTQLHIIGGSQSRQLATLRKFLKQNSISSALALRISRSAQHAISGDLTQDAVELLPVVSEPLRVEMHFEMYSVVMRNHPFLADYIQESPQVMRRVCHYATSTLLLSSTDVVFSQGEAPSDPKMYIVCKGILDYSSLPSKGLDGPVNERQCIAEAVLWTRWTYRGTLTATCDAKLAALDATAFQDIVVRFKESGGFDPKVYAADFVAHLNSLVNTAVAVTDLTQLRY
jgi:hypothetical protein